MPIAREKIVYASLRLKFLGIVIDGENRVLRILHDKKEQALHILKLMNEKKKVTVKQIQILAGLLNFYTESFTQEEHSQDVCTVRLVQKQET